MAKKLEIQGKNANLAEYEKGKKVFVRIWTEKTEYGRKCGFGAEMHKKESRSEKVWGI